MKKLMHWSLIVAFSIGMYSCEKSVEKGQDEPAPRNLSVVLPPSDAITTVCPTPYVIILESITQVGSNYEWVWSVSNPNPGNGSDGTVQNLSHWDIELGQCATMDDIVGAAYSGDGVTWTPFIPTYEEDASMLNACSLLTGPVLKFDFGTSGTAKSYYKLVLNKSLNIDMGATAFYKSGNTTGCGTQCFPGLGCPDEVVEGCSFSQGYWFAKPGLVWPGNVTIGGYSYTQAEGVAIWKSSNAGGIGTAKKVFLQAAAIKLSGTNVSPTATVWPYVQAIDAWLTTLPKLTPANVKSFNGSPDAAEALAAADAVAAWIEAHHCE